MILLKTVNLRKQFGETRACDGLDFVVNKGEFLSLVGSNGAGKTTLVNLISAHLQPDSGQILLEDRDITYMSVADRIKAGIARSFQIVNLFDGLSVFDNVALSIFSREGKTVRMAALADHDYDVRQEALEVLGEFGLSGKAGALAGGLAQGERKLLDVAVAVRKRRDFHGLALARENRQRDIVEDGERIEQVYDLEAAGNTGPDAFMNSGEGYVRALEQDAAAVRGEMAAD